MIDTPAADTINNTTIGASVSTRLPINVELCLEQVRQADGLVGITARRYGCIYRRVGSPPLWSRNATRPGNAVCSGPTHPWSHTRNRTMINFGTAGTNKRSWTRSRRTLGGAGHQVILVGILHRTLAVDLLQSLRGCLANIPPRQGGSERFNGTLATYPS